MQKRGAKEDWLASERRSFQVRFSRQPDSVILFPAPYPTGIANLGFLTVWRRLNSIPGFSCDRACWDPASKNPPLGLETRLPLKAFPIIFVSSSFEMDLGAVIRALLTASIEPLARQRRLTDPIIVAGGISLSLNPAPWASIVDLALLGEGEEAVEQWVEVYRGWRKQKGMREELFQLCAKLPFAWIPDLPEREVIPAVYDGYDSDPADSSAVNYRGHFGDCWLVELTRGCPRGCLFCAVCGVYPARFAQAETVLEKLQASHGLGARKIGLVGGAVGDHPGLKRLIHDMGKRGRKITVSSLRIERSDAELLNLLAENGMKTLTVAPETGGEGLRRRIGKKATDEDLIALAKTAGHCGIKRLRLYFLIGLPEEEPPEEIIVLLKQLRQEAPGSLKLDVSISSFIPKPATPWERAPFAPSKQLDEIKRKLRTELKASTDVEIHLKPTRAEREAALLSRGDAALGEALVRAIRSERPLEQEMRVSGMDAEKYLDFSHWQGDLPWGMIGRHK